MNENPKQIEQVNVSLDVVWHGRAGKYDARVSEISLEGCFIDSMGQEVLGETIDFKMHLPAGPWVTLRGLVTYQEYPIGFELRFTDLTAENKRLIAQVVAAHGGRQAQEFLKAEAAEEVAAPSSPVESRRVLIADDDAMTVRMLRVIVETEGYEAVSAPDGREAFRILQQDGNFGAAIFDMMMPHLYGMDLIHYMKTDERLRKIPIGMITAEQDPKIWDESITAGARVFLPKPFTPPQVQMMLRILFSKSNIAENNSDL